MQSFNHLPLDLHDPLIRVFQRVEHRQDFAGEIDFRLARREDFIDRPDLGWMNQHLAVHAKIAALLRFTTQTRFIYDGGLAEVCSPPECELKAAA